MDTLENIAREWNEAKKVIEEFIRELRPDMALEFVDHNAAALIARLAHKNLIITKVEG
jgi:hypothetical protein